MGKKYPKDPNAPKKPTRPFIYYMIDVAKNVKEELSMNAPQENVRMEVSKECGRRWSAMTTDEKEKYHEKFREDAKRYQEDLKTYKPSDEYLEKARLAKLHNISVTSSPSSNMARVPHMVRSYFDYLASSWSTVAASLPRLEPDQVQEEVWRRWCEGEPGGNAWDENQNVVKKQLKKRIRKRVKKDPTNVKAPRTAFQCFLETMKDELRKHLPDMSYTDMVKHVSAKWKVMSAEQKEPFHELERKEKEEHKAKVNAKQKEEFGGPVEDMKENDVVPMSSSPNQTCESANIVEARDNEGHQEAAEEEHGFVDNEAATKESDSEERKLEMDLSDSSDEEYKEVAPSAARLSVPSSTDDSSDSEENSSEEDEREVV